MAFFFTSTMDGSKVGSIPFLMSADFDYLDEVNSFLRQRASGAWEVSGVAVSDYGRKKKLADNSIDSLGRDLENFFNWLEYRKLDWRAIKYDDVLRYEREMAKGLWSADRKPLVNSTINRRGDSATHFLAWSDHHGLRAHFPVPKQLKKHSAGGSSGRTHVVVTRSGRRRPHPSRLRLPSENEVERWLQNVLVRRGRTKALACETILETGMRREEVASLRATDVPEPDLFSLGAPARMEIRYGTKGEREPGDANLEGKPRLLRFEVSFLRRLHNYKVLRRPFALMTFKKLHPGFAAPKEMFLSEQTGEPISANAIYNAWHLSDRLPFPGFSPHIGRHCFACWTLLHRLKERLNTNLSLVDKSIVIAEAGNLIEIYIKPVMGHLYVSTTEQYLDWVADHVWVAEARQRYTDYLDMYDAASS